MMSQIKGILFALLACSTSPARAECVDVKYRDGGPVCLDSFSCESVSRSSQVTRVCYDSAKRYMVIGLKQRSGEAIYYHYCEVSKPVVDGLLAADSMERYFEGNIRSKRDGTRESFDCRDLPALNY